MPGLMNGEMKTAPTNPPPAPRKPGHGSLGIDGSLWKGGIGGADRQLRDWIQGGAG